MMEHIIYSKYSNERAARFQIRTDIIVQDNKQRYVRKSACTKEAQAHIDQIYEYGKKLNETYQGTILCVNECKKQNEELIFEYLQGQTFEEYLDAYLLNNDYMSVIAEIKKFFDVLSSAMPLQQFYKTEQFTQVFGDIEFPSVLQAAEFSNIDFIFGNIFMEKDKWTVIDYEWTFDFPIPYLYIVYRAIHYYTFDKARENAAELNLLAMFGITKELEKSFELMEHRFQLYILGNMTPVVNMYPYISGRTFFIDKLLADEKEVLDNHAVRIYYDYGEGFSEENSRNLDSCHFDAQNQLCKYRIPTQGAASVRLDPMEASCFVKIVSVICNGAESKRLKYTTNGFLLEDQCYVFVTADPCIIFSKIDADVNEIEILCRVESLSREAAAGFRETRMMLLSESEHRQKTQAHLEDCQKNYRNAVQQIEALQQQNIELQSQYDAINHSASMKITKPLRGLKKVAKKIVKSNKVTYKCARGLKCLKENGFRYTYRRTKEKIKNKWDSKWTRWGMSKKEIMEQRKKTFSKPVLFSIIVPLYNTPKQFLVEMIESVQDQTYGSWELCMADGSDEEHAYVEKICRKYNKKDTRIKYKKLTENGGISENTNSCLQMAEGDYIALFDHDDLLHPSALFENMCVIEEQDADFIYSDEDTFSTKPSEAYCPHYKPDFSPDTLRSYNYICHFSVFKRSLLQEVGLFRKEFDGSQDYDMILRLTERAGKIVHIPKIIYYWRAHKASVASDISAKTYCLDAAKKALGEHLARIGLKGEVLDASIPSVYKMQYEIEGEPLISILIPNKDYIEDLSTCVHSILDKSTYRNFEIIIIENNSEKEETFAYYEEIEQREQVQVVYWKDEFNYSAINNYGFSFVKGEYVLLLNNDVEVITPDWLQEMLMFAQRKDVGAVGAKLYYPDNTVQHAGIILGIGGVAGHSHKNYPRDAYGYCSRLQLAQNLSAVTAACMMVPRKVFEEVNGLDESFKVAFNDVDFCMRIRQAGYLIIFTPFAELFHYESKSRGYENTPEKVERFNGEIRRFYSKWDAVLDKGDPYYNPNLTLCSEDFSIKPKGEIRPRA